MTVISHMRYVIPVIVLIILAGGAWYLLQPAPVPQMPAIPEVREPDVIPTPQAGIEWHNASADDIRVAQPLPGVIVSRTFAISGEARGGWFFEASFPMEVLDADGNQLLAGFIEADGDWMTSEFVPFATTTAITGGYAGPATLVLHRDNASGLPENDKSVSIPIVIR